MDVNLSLTPPSLVEIAAQYQTVSYIFATYLTAYVYDWLLSIPEEYAILVKSGFSRSNAIYLFSRIISLSDLVGVAGFPITPVDSCQGLEYATGASCVLSTMSTSFLFLLRVRAVYQNSRTITALFGSSWLLMIALSVWNATSLHTAYNPYTRRCIIVEDDFIIIPRSVVTCVNDTMIFLAISYRLARNAATCGSWRAGIRSFIKGEGLYSLSKSILQSGQLYYLAAIAFFFVNLVMMISPGVPGPMRYILVSPYAAFANIMACRVFRGVALGIIEDSALTTTKIAAAFQSASLVSVDELTLGETPPPSLG